MSRDCGWKSFSRNPRRHSVIHRRYTPWSIRGQRNPESRDCRPRSARSQDPEYRNLKRKRRRKNFSLLKTSMDDFLHSNCTSTEQESILLHQHDVGVDDEKETTTTSQQAAVREEFASPTEKRQQQGTTAWATEQNKQFDRGRSY